MVAERVTVQPLPTNGSRVGTLTAAVALVVPSPPPQLKLTSIPAPTAAWLGRRPGPGVLLRGDPGGGTGGGAGLVGGVADEAELDGGEADQEEDGEEAA